MIIGGGDLVRRERDRPRRMIIGDRDLERRERDRPRRIILGDRDLERPWRIITGDFCVDVERDALRGRYGVSVPVA